ncbi:MAG: hypothetical protein QOH96_3763 [Blastocatellia bacterium]|nr:hypothetical protein [Blastocatellia bacterium]
MPDIDTKAAGFRRLSPCSLAVVANELRPAFPLSEIQARKLPSSVAAVRFEQNEVPTMSKTERKDKSTKGTQENTDDEENLVGDSPEEKLHGVPPRDSAVPGAQNPDSVEIKKEVNPNTE